MSHQVKDILDPQAIAVAGASSEGRGGGFVTPLIELGFKGPIYPVNPKYEEVSGMVCYPTVRDIPGEVDYVISSVPSTAALDLMKDCVAKGVKCVHYFTARFSETGRPEDAALEREILKTAREGGVRIIGPNCMGLYNPAAGISMSSGLPRESGSVGFASQSGGVLQQIVRSSAQRGLRFSKAISYGNAIDLNECDYLEYFADDPDTSVILMYIEGLEEGRRFIRALDKVTERKPVVIMKGGRSGAGNRAAASHTASLAGSYSLTQALVHGAGGVTVKDFDELVDLAVAFHYLPPTTGRNLGVQGGSGGSSVNAADLLAEAGLNVVPIPQAIRDQLKAEGIAQHDWFNNPIDGSITMGNRSSGGRLMELMAEHDDFHTLISFAPGPGGWGPCPGGHGGRNRGQGRGGHGNPGVNGSGDLDVDAILEQSLHRKTTKPVVMLGSEMRGMPGMEEMADVANQIRQRLIEDGVATFPTMTRAANALGKLTGFYDYQRARTGKA